MQHSNTLSIVSSYLETEHSYPGSAWKVGNKDLALRQRILLGCVAREPDHHCLAARNSIADSWKSSSTSYLPRHAYVPSSEMLGPLRYLYICPKARLPPHLSSHHNPISRVKHFSSSPPQALKMKEAIIRAGPKVEIVDSPIPKPAKNQIVTKVVYSGSNPKDW